jgi:hypothetical protein
MQPPPAPAAPAVPQPPAARPTAVALPDGPLPLEALPKSAQDIQGLHERREILRDQLERATNRRQELVNDLNAEEHPVAPEARVGIQQRLDVIDARILQIERDQAMTERLLSNAPPAVLAQAAAIEEARQHRGATMDEDEAAGWMFATFGIGVLLTLVVGRVRRRLHRRRGAARGVPVDGAAVIQDPRFDRLAQAVDAIAEEVERIGEGQRFVTQLLAQRPQEAPPIAAPTLRAEAERR